MKIKLLALLAVLIFIGCTQKENDEQIVTENAVIPYQTGDIITLKGVEGGEKKLKKTKDGFVLLGEENKILMLDIFGTFCPPCQEEAPNLTAYNIQNSDNFVLIGLTYLENVDDKYVVDNFSNKFNGHYFITNSKNNPKLVASIVKDIDYKSAILLPFKVVLKNGIYQELTDVWEKKEGIKYYVGNVGMDVIKNDMNKILNK